MPGRVLSNMRSEPRHDRRARGARRDRLGGAFRMTARGGPAGGRKRQPRLGPDLDGALTEHQPGDLTFINFLASVPLLNTVPRSPQFRRVLGFDITTGLFSESSGSPRIG